jgi:hypothetical protein
MAEERGAARMNTTIAIVLSCVALSAAPASVDPTLAVAVGLVPIVEKVEPERSAEYLGRSLALRTASGDQIDPNDSVTAWWSRELPAMMRWEHVCELFLHLWTPARTDP